MTPITTTIAAGESLTITTMPQGGRATITHTGYLQLLEIVDSTSVGRYENRSAGSVTLDVTNATWSAVNLGSSALEITIEKAFTEILGSPGVARQLAVGGSSANTALTPTARRLSMRAVGCDVRFAIGVGAQTASSATHFIADGERLDFAVAAGSNIAVLRNATTSGVLEVTELV